MAMDQAARPSTDVGVIPDAEPSAVAINELADETEGVSHRRDRLLSSLVFIAGVALFLGAPFALRAGAIFFMPIAVALVITLMLVPAQEWLERHRVPPGLAALLVLLMFLAIANLTLVAIVLPATAWVQMLPARVPQIQANLAPIVEMFAAFERLFERLSDAMGAGAAAGQSSVVVDQANSALELVTQSAPAALVQMLLIVLLVYFLLSAYTQMRISLIRNRNSFSGSLRVARMIRDTVSSTASYLLTVSIINLGLGAAVAGVVWMLGMPSPLMWGGIAAVLNFVPYVGAIVTTGLLALGGLIVFDNPWSALAPAAAFFAIQIVESNVVTPQVVGQRLTINPLAILLALSFWGWVWGTVGALIAVPLLIMFKVILDRAGTPDIVGFLFDDQMLADSQPD